MATTVIEILMPRLYIIENGYNEEIYLCVSVCTLIQYSHISLPPPP